MPGKANMFLHQSFRPSPLRNDQTYQAQRSTPNLPLRPPYGSAPAHLAPTVQTKGPLNSNPVTLADLAYVAYLQECSGLAETRQRAIVSNPLPTRSDSILNERVRTANQLEASGIKKAELSPPLPEFVSDLERSLRKTGSIESLKVMNSAASEAREKRLKGSRSLPFLSRDAGRSNPSAPPVPERHVLWADPSESGGFEAVKIATAKTREPSYGVLNGVANTPRVLKRGDEL